MNYARIDENDVFDIANGLEKCKTASELALLINKDVSGLIKHIKKYRVLIETRITNRCGDKSNCHISNLCESCRANKYRKEERECRYCKYNNCNNICPRFDLIPNCNNIKKFPYVCNGCSKRIYCHLNHYIYDPNKVISSIKNIRSNSRRNTHATSEELNRLSNLLKPLILEKHQSLPQIYLTHKEEIGWSYVTLLNYIDKGLIPNIKNIDLTKRVKYPIHYKKKNNEPSNLMYVKSRTYDDFVSFISNDLSIEVVEMDTVLSCRQSKACLLTLLFRKSNFMLAFKLNDKTSNEVTKLFSYIKNTLGLELYKETFKCILTDNGTEFANPIGIEFDSTTGERISWIFYCDPGKSNQKGKIEKNHVELRKIFPKGVDFSKYTQEDINKAMSHINSMPRAILNRNSPGIIAKIFLNEKVLALNKYQFIEPDNVLLDKKLVR